MAAVAGGQTIWPTLTIAICAGAVLWSVAPAGLNFGQTLYLLLGVILMGG